MKRKPTVSHFGRAQSCTYPWTSNLAWPRFETSPAAEFGNAVHKVAEHLALREPVPADIASRYQIDEEQTRRLARCGAKVEKWLEGREVLKVEVPYAYSVGSETVRRLNTSGHRDYRSAGPDELPGTADLVTMEDGLVIVSDYKTGRRENVDPCRENAQMRALALYTAIDMGVEEVGARLVFVDEDGVDDSDMVVFDAWELDEIRIEIAQMWESFKEKRPPVAGKHCRYCPIADACPETGKAIALVEATPHFAITSPEQGYELRERLKIVEDLVKKAKNQLNEYAKRTPLVGPDGYVYAVKEYESEDIRLGPESIGVMESTLGKETTEQIIRSLKVTKKALSDAAPDNDTAKKTIDALRESGCVSTSKYTRFARFKRKEEKKAS